MKYCSRCIMPDSRPRASFKDGICNACLWHDFKRTIDWGARWKKLEEICSKYRRHDGEYDCIIPISGGKDSSYIAKRFRDDLGMHPLTITFNHPIPSRIGWQNWLNLIYTGFSNRLITPDPRAYRMFARDSLISKGLPKQPFVCGISTSIIREAKKRI